MNDLFAALNALDLSDEARALLQRLQPRPSPQIETLIDRLSLVRTFTADTYAAAADGLVDAPAFESFTGQASAPDHDERVEAEPVAAFAVPSPVEELFDAPGRYAIVERARAARLEQWRARPKEERLPVVRKLLEALERSAPHDPIERLDRLQLLFLDDRTYARQELRAAFEAANDANDLAACGALVQLLASTIALFGEDDCRALLAELRGRSQARNLFVSEFYQTTRYHPRPIEDQLHQFLHAGDDRWIFHLHAIGGMGKTTMLRRLISHKWIVGAAHVPCAWVDFDYVDVGNVLQMPALLGLAMAAQWNEQLAQPVFGEFLAPSLQSIASLLFRQRPDGSAKGLESQAATRSSQRQYRATLSNPMRCGLLAGAVPPRTLDERERRLTHRQLLYSHWNDKLPDALTKLPTDRPVLLLIDTVEEASLEYGAQLLDLLTVLRQLRDQARKLAIDRGQRPIDLRLILSGRHELGRDHVPEFARRFAGEYIVSSLDGLERHESIRFLEREIDTGVHASHRSALIEAMADRSGGLPFNLALYAEWANDDTALTPAIVKQSHDVSTARLIERILKRIPSQPLRWIVRYGVVPRRLTLAFLQDVMRGPLIEALSGESTKDKRDVPDSELEVDTWTREDGFIFDADTLWQQKVVPYVSARSWIMPGEQVDQVVFRTDILQPMRELLRRQPIFAQLHEASRRWYAARASQPESQISASIEALYHAVQLRTIGPQPRESAQGRVDEGPHERGADADSPLVLLRELLDMPALAEPALRVRACLELRTADFSDLTSAEHAYVCYRLAEALVALQDFTFRTSEATRYLTAAFAYQDDAGIDVLPRFAHVWRQAVEGVSLSVMLGAMNELERDDLLRLAMLLSELADSPSPIVRDVLEGALSMAQNQPSPAVPVGLIAARLATVADDAESAIRYLTMAADDFARRGQVAQHANMLHRASLLESQLGRLTRADARLSGLPATIANEPPILLQRANLELAKGNTKTALVMLDRHDERVSPDARSLEALVLRAEALSQRLMITEALDAWERAARVASEHANVAAIAVIAVAQARFYWTWLRVSSESTQAPVRILRHARPLADEAAVPAAKEIAVWQIVYGAPDMADRALRTLGEPGNTPDAHVRLLLAISHHQPLPERRWQELIECASRLPRSAGIMALVEPVLLGPPPKISSDLRRGIARAFSHEPEGPIESAWYAVRYGELLAWLGFHDQALELLARHIPPLTPASFQHEWIPVVTRERRRIEQRIRDWKRARGLDDGPTMAVDPPALWWDPWKETPQRAAAALVENAQRAYAMHQSAIAEECLELARPALELSPIRTGFHDMAASLRESIRPAGFGVAGSDEADVAYLVDDRSAPLTVIALGQQGGRLVVDVRRSPGDDLRAPILISAAGNETLETALRAKGVPRRLVRSKLTSIARDLADSLESIRSERVVGPDARLALRIPPSSLACLPWESAFSPDRQPCRMPSMESPPSRFAPLHPGNERPLLVMPMTGMDVESPAAPDYALLSRKMEGRFDPREAAHAIGGAAVVYIATTLSEVSRLSEPVLGGLGWTCETLVHAMNRNYGVRPMVVLDVPAPVTESQFLHQLFLRNLFAQALIDSNAVACVLATGLRPLGMAARLHDTILSALNTPGQSRLGLLAHIARHLVPRDTVPHDALFTANPDHPCLPEQGGDFLA